MSNQGKVRRPFDLSNRIDRLTCLDLWRIEPQLGHLQGVRTSFSTAQILLSVPWFRLCSWLQGQEIFTAVRQPVTK